MNNNILMPSYGKVFNCIMGDCPENCCVEWIVDLDDKTLNCYRNSEGKIGEKIRSHMLYDSEEDETQFSLVKGKNHVREWGLTINDSGEAEIVYNSEAEGFDMNCPFQQDDGLCEIRLKLGYLNTSETCREHPEFNEEYENFIERSFSLSCPEVARLIAETPLKNSIASDRETLTASKVYPPAPNASEDSVLNLLVEKRNEFFENFDEDKNLFFQINALRKLSFSIQPRLNVMDEGFAVEIPDPNIMFLGEILESFLPMTDTGLKEQDIFKKDVINLLDFMNENLDFLTMRWKKMLDGSLQSLKSKEFSVEKFYDFCDKNRKHISRIFAYFVYRYFLKAVNECDEIKWSEFIIKSAFVPVFMSFSLDKDLFRVAALYSREIEHDGDNAALLLDLR